MRRTAMRRTAGLVGLMAVLAASGVLPAVGVPGLTASAPTTTAVAQGVATRLTGMSVSGAADGDTLAVTVATSRGTVRVDTSTGIVLAYGNTASGSSVSFTGTPAQVNAALAATDLTTPAGSMGQTATVTLTAYPQQAGIVYGAATGHFYEFVPASTSWDTARTQATLRGFLGKAGYLVNITDSAENAIVTSRIPNAQSVWIGAHATASGGYAREWRWADGPESGQVFDRCSNGSGTCDFVSRPGYSNWSSGEPNNWGGSTGVDGEWVAVTNWSSYNGLWNDLASSSSTTGYVVEYGDGSAFSGVATASSTMTILGVPGAPTSVSATPGSEQATVSFAAPASDGGSAITSYTVTAWPGGATATCPGSPCTVTGLTAWTSYTFTVTATSAVGTGSASAPSAAVTAVPQPSAPGAPDGPAGTPVVGVPFSATVSATGYPFPTFSVTDGALPDGLVLAADGSVTGTPTTPGPWSAEITATNSEGAATATPSGYVGLVPPAITGSLGTIPAGESVSAELNADGYPTPTWTVTGGALPDGLTLSYADGRITGTPTTPGAYSVTVTAQNAHGSVARTLTGSVTEPPGPVTGTVPQLLVGVPESTTFSAAGYPPPTFAVTAGGLPAGMSLDPDTGVLAGTPTVAGPWSVTIAATNDRGTVTRVLSGHVGNPPSAVTGTLPALVWGSPVAVLLSSSGYPAPTYSVTAGALPAGLALDASTGALSGTPTSATSYSVTVTAANDHGSQSVTFTGAVAPIRPSAPSGLTADPGDGEAVLTFDAPASDGGAPVTGYEVRVDDGDWHALDVTVDGSTVRGTVSGLVNGESVDVRVRAVNVAGAGTGSGRASVTPVAPPPAPVAAPTAVAGTSSVTVTWAASSERDVTGYTVIASPGQATCDVDADETSCVVGAVAGQAVTFRVVTHSRWGDSEPSAPSLPVVPRAPAVPPTPPASAPTTLTTSDGPVSRVATGQSVTVIGTGFAPYSTATVVIYSQPRVLGTVVTDATGAFSLTVTVPADLEAGEHTFVAYGTDPVGESYAMRLPVSVPAATPAVAATGAAVEPLLLTALLLVLSGTTLHRLGSRRARRHA